MSIKPPADPSSSLGATPKQSSQRIVIVLLLVIAILLAVVAGLLLTREMKPAATTASASPTAAQEPATPEPSAPAPSTEETSAPSLTDPKALELAHGEVTRDANDPRAMGKADAPVVMVIYSDFACPYCTMFAQDVEPALADLVESGTLRIEWRDLAQITATSPLAAQAGIAAGNQGRFWEFHDAVYAAADPQGHPEYTEDSLVNFAKQAGVPDLDRFRSDMNDPATTAMVTQATQHAHSIGIQATPFMIINDALISGYRPADYMRSTITEQAARAS